MPKWTIEQQRAIAEEGMDILVSAGAGSGKTAVLTERVLQKLKKGIPIDSLLILTFTNAAASEMKQRIRNKMKEDVSLREQLNRIDSAYITTFDSFALSIVKKYHYKENIGKDVSIVSAAFIEKVKREKLDFLFAQYYEREEECFFELLKTFTSKDDKKIREALLLLDQKMEQEVDKETFLKEYSFHFFGEEYKAKIRKEYMFLLEEMKTEIWDCMEVLKREVDGSYLEKLQKVLENIFATHLLMRLPSLPKESSIEAKKTKEKIKKKLEEFCSLQEEDIEEKIKGYLKNQPMVEMVLKIIQELDEKVWKFKKENDLFEFIDIEKLAIQLLQKNEDIRRDLQKKFKEIMIDEYQDTNDIGEAFLSLFKNNNCYMVGDVKQSIYRFRNANPTIFKEKYEKFSLKQGGIKIDMNQNFRSRSEVIEDINHLFSKLMHLDFGGADYTVSHQMLFGNQDYVSYAMANDYHMSIYTYEDTTNTSEMEAHIIAQDILKKIEEGYKVYDKEEECLRPITFQDFAILLDRTTSADEYKKIFESYQIPLTILKETSILENDLLQIIKNGLHFLFALSKGEDFTFYFLSLARSFLYEYSDEELFSIVMNKKIKETEIYKKIVALKKKEETLPPSLLLEEMIQDLEIEEKLYKIGDYQENIKLIDTVLNLAEELEKMGYTSYDLQKFFDEISTNTMDIKIASPRGGGNSVSFMTIHKSKGLEFPICYFAGLTKKFNTSDLNELFLYDKEYGILLPYYDEGIRDTVVKTLLKEKYKKEEVSEKIRLFYVALTRAKEKMIFVCPKFKEGNPPKQKEMKSFYDFLWYTQQIIEPYIKEVQIEMPKKKSKVALERKEEVETIFVSELCFKTQGQRRKTYSKKTMELMDEKTKTEIREGLEIHRAFEQIDFEEPSNTKYQKYIDAFLKQEIVKDRQKAQIFKEYEFIYTKENVHYHGIIDLMLVYETHIVLIDYKLNNTKEKEYLKQLKGYKDYIQEKTGKDVFLYLYSILQNQMEQVEE